MRIKNEKFEYWLENIFWYHYKWYYIIGLFVLTLLISWVVTMVSQVNYDWTVVYAHRGTADPENLSKITECYSEYAEDTDSNGRVRVKAVEILMTDTPEEPLYGPLSDSDYLVFFMDDYTAEKYTQLGYFEELSSGMNTVYISSLDLYAAVNYAPYKMHYNYENEYSVYSDSEMAALNELMSEKHDKAAVSAITVLEALSKIQNQD